MPLNPCGQWLGFLIRLRQLCTGWLRELKVPTRRGGEARFKESPPRCKDGNYRNPEWLRQKYVVEQKSASEIARSIGANPATILRRLSLLGIPKRTPAEASKLAGNMGRFRPGDEHPKYRRPVKGEMQFVNQMGYVMVRGPRSPMTGKVTYHLEHRVIMSKHLGRALDGNDIVHHINGVKIDNRIENLRLLTPKEHSPVLHVQEQLDQANAEIARLHQLCADFGVDTSA